MLRLFYLPYNRLCVGEVNDNGQLYSGEQPPILGSLRHVNMTLSLSLLSPELFKVAVEGRCLAASVWSSCANSRSSGVASSRLRLSIQSDQRHLGRQTPAEIQRSKEHSECPKA